MGGITAEAAILLVWEIKVPFPIDDIMIAGSPRSLKDGPTISIVVSIDPLDLLQSIGGVHEDGARGGASGDHSRSFIEADLVGRRQDWTGIQDHKADHKAETDQEYSHSQVGINMSHYQKTIPLTQNEWRSIRVCLASNKVNFFQYFPFFIIFFPQSLQICFALFGIAAVVIQDRAGIQQTTPLLFEDIDRLCGMQLNLALQVLFDHVDLCVRCELELIMLAIELDVDLDKGKLFTLLQAMLCFGWKHIVRKMSIQEIPNSREQSLDTLLRNNFKYNSVPQGNEPLSVIIIEVWRNQQILGIISHSMLPKSRVAFCLLLLFFLALTISSVDSAEGLSPLKQTPVCMKGQFVLNGMCQPCFLQTQFCKECGNINSKSLSNCYTCEPFFTLSPNYTCLRCLATNCIACAYNSKICKTCETKYFLTSQGNCERCPNNCGKCDTDTDQPVCLSSGCAIGTAFVVNATTGSCAACAHRSCIDCSDPQSGLLLSNGTCAKCINNYYLSQDNFCFPCMLHCSKCNLGNCSQCDIGFYLSPATSSSGSQCLECSHPCLECTSLNFCTRCDPGHYLKAESNITNDCMSCFIPACQNCLVNAGIQNQTTCSLCGPGYIVLQTGKCFPCVPNCLTCGSSTTCLRCNIGYFKNGTSTLIQCVACLFKCATCSSKTVCNVCQPLYFLTNNICLPCPLYCLSCPGGVCQKCRDGYSAKGETPNLCTPCTPPCLTCLSSQECTSCQSGYYQSRGQCLNCQKSCIHCLGVGQCFSCHEGYYAMAQNQVGGSVCAQCPVGCTRCKMMSGSLGCQSCEEGFLLVSTACAEMSGMPWWGIFLIVTFTLLVFAGVGYLIRRNYSSGGTGGYGYVEMGRT